MCFSLPAVLIWIYMWCDSTMKSSWLSRQLNFVYIGKGCAITRYGIILPLVNTFQPRGSHKSSSCQLVIPSVPPMLGFNLLGTVFYPGFVPLHDRKGVIHQTTINEYLTLLTRVGQCCREHDIQWREQRSPYTCRELGFNSANQH